MSEATTITPRTRWRDGMAINVDDLNDEQSHQELARRDLVLDLHGEGVVLEERLQPLVFNSKLFPSPLEDGRPVVLELPMEDQINGSLLELNVTMGNLDGYSSARLILTGVDRNNKDFIEEMEFGTNDRRLTRSFYKKLRAFTPAGLLSSGARLVIKEASSLEIDKDFIMVEQIDSPNIFLRDFPSFNPLFTDITGVIASTVNDVTLLNLDIGGLEQITLLEDDTTTIIGQKFQATTDNIQKVQLLLSLTRDTSVSPPSNPDDPNPQFDWSGDIVVSIRELSTSVKCPGDIVPQNPIDFPPELVTLTQISIDKNDLEDMGVRLDDTPTPINFVFSTTPIGRAGESAILVPGKYYAITVQRQGAASKGKVLIDVGHKRNTSTVFTSFDGKDWLDNDSKDLWFRVFTNASLVAPGVAYDNGIRVSVDKVQILPSGQTVSFIDDNNSFADSGEDVPNLITIEQRETLIDPEPDTRTGNPVPTRIRDDANISTFTQQQYDNLTNKTVLLGIIQDENIKAGTNLVLPYGAADFSVGHTMFFTQFPPPFLGKNLKDHIFIPDANCAHERFRIISNTDDTITVEQLFNPDPSNPVDLPAEGFGNPGLAGLSYEIRFFPTWREENVVVLDERIFIPKSFLETDEDGYDCLAFMVNCDLYVEGKIFPESYGSVDSYGNSFSEGYLPVLMDAHFIEVNTIPGLIARPTNLQLTLEQIQKEINLFALSGGFVDSAAIIPADGTTGQDNTIGTGVKTNHVQDGAITNPKLADDAVGTSKIQNASVTNPKLAANAVNTINLVDGSVTNPKLADGAVSTSKIQDGAVTPSKLSFTVGGGLPSGTILMLFGSTCPPGTVRESSLDGLFPRGAPTGSPAAVGTDTHDHGTHTHTGTTNTTGAHTHTFSTLVSGGFTFGPTWGFDNPFPGGPAAGVGHGHGAGTVSGTTGSAGNHSHTLNVNPSTVPVASHVPRHADVLYCTVT